MKKAQHIIESKYPCPVCGGHKWCPLAEVDNRLYYTSNEVTEPLIDDKHGYPNSYDECLACGTVIC